MTGKRRDIMHRILETVVMTLLGCLGVEVYRATAHYYRGWEVDRMRTRISVYALADEIDASGLELATGETFNEFGQRVQQYLCACPFSPDGENPFPALLYPGGKYGHLQVVPSEPLPVTPLLWFEGDREFSNAIQSGAVTSVPALVFQVESGTTNGSVYACMLTIEGLRHALAQIGANSGHWGQP